VLLEKHRLLTPITQPITAIFSNCLIATSSYAQPTPKWPSPPVDGTATAAPTEIRLNFSEAVILKFSSVELRDQSGMQVATGKFAIDSKDEKQLIVPLQAPLKAGKYTVKWVAVAADTHRVNGTYSFKVVP